MKTNFRIFTLVLLTAVMVSCRDQFTEVFTANSPIYMSYDELRAAVKPAAPRDLENPGKIYFKDDYIFVVEEMKGFHLIDVSNPASPQKKAFMQIPGCVDIAVKENILYADSYVDMVAIDVSDINNMKEIKRVKDVFPYTVPPAGNEYRLAEVDKGKGVVIDWEVKKVRQEMEYQYYPVYPIFYRGYAEKLDGAYYTASAGISNSSGVGGSSGTSFGVGGSMARFGLYKEYLYTVDNRNLYMFDVKVPSAPSSIGKQNVGWQVETMFIYGDYMFFGTTTGMLIYDLKIPTYPEYIAQFWHATSCDPVVISDGYAYITLRSGRTCTGNASGTLNRLDVVKLSADYKNNNLVMSYPMHEPAGLGIDGDILFLCDGDAGLKVFNVSDKRKIDVNQIATFPGIQTYDVIPVNNYLFMVGDDGFYLYDYSNLQNIKQIGLIPVKK